MKANSQNVRVPKQTNVSQAVKIMDTGYLVPHIDPTTPTPFSYADFNPTLENLRATFGPSNGYFHTRLPSWIGTSVVKEPLQDGDQVVSSREGTAYPATFAWVYNTTEKQISADGKTFPVAIEESVNLGNLWHIGFSFDGQTYIDPNNPRFGFEKVDASEAYRITDIHNGEFVTSLRVTDTAIGASADFITKVLVNRTQPNLGAVQTKVIPHYNGKLYYRASLESGQNDGIDKYLVESAPRQLKFVEAGISGNDNQNQTLVMKTTKSDITIVMSQHVAVRDTKGKPITGSQHHIDKTSENGFHSIFQEGTLPVQKEHTVSVEKTVAIATSEHFKSAKDHLNHLMYTAQDVDVELSFDAQRHAHTQTWNKWWDAHRDVIIKQNSNDPDAALAQTILDFNTFMMGSGYTDLNVKYNIIVGQLARFGHYYYRGKVFWDELYTMSFYRQKMPEVAKTLSLFRVASLGAARENAMKLPIYPEGNSGKAALFPHQGMGLLGRSGEGTPAWHKSGSIVKPDISYKQYHSNLAIAYNILAMYEATADPAWFTTSSQGYGVDETLLSVGLLIRDKVELGQDGRYHFTDIVGPNEFHDHMGTDKEHGVDDNAYTNVMIAWYMNKLLDMMKIMEKSDPSALANRRKEMGIDDATVAKWEDISNKMYININTDGIIEEHAGYFDLAEVDIASLNKEFGFKRARRLDRLINDPAIGPELKKRWGVNGVNELKVDKQADVLMMWYVLGQQGVSEVFVRLGYEAPSLRDNLAYYEPRTTHGSTLSAVVYGKLASQVGLTDLAEQLGAMAMTSDVSNTVGDAVFGDHRAVMNGTIENTLKEGGLVEGPVLSLDPNLSADTKEIRFGVRHYRSVAYRYTAKPHGQFTLEILSGLEKGKPPVPFKLGGVEVKLEKNGVYHFPQDFLSSNERRWLLKDGVKCTSDQALEVSMNRANISSKRIPVFQRILAEKYHPLRLNGSAPVQDASRSLASPMVSHAQLLVAGRLLAQYAMTVTNPDLLLTTIKEKEPQNIAAIDLVENLMGTPAMDAFMDIMNNELHPEHPMVHNNADLRELYATKGLANVTPDEVLATLKAPDKLVVMYDFDGVVASADHYHKKAFDYIVREYYGFADGLSDAENDKVRGMGRAETIAAVLLIKTKGFDADISNPGEAALALGFKLKDGRTFDHEAWQDLTQKKNDKYREIIASEFGPQDAIPGTNVVMQTVAQLGGDNVEATTSRNTDHMAEAVGALKFFDARSTGHTYQGSKPHPACFVTAAMLRGFGPGAIGLEDASKGVQSINAAGHLSIGLGQSIKEAYPDLQAIKSVADIQRLDPANDWSSWNSGDDFITDRPDFWVESMKDLTPEMLRELQQLALQKATRPGAKEGYRLVIADKLDQARKNPSMQSALAAQKKEDKMDAGSLVTGPPAIIPPGLTTPIAITTKADFFAMMGELQKVSKNIVSQIHAQIRHNKPIFITKEGKAAFENALASMEALKHGDRYLVSLADGSQRAIKFDIEMHNLKKQIAFFECLQEHSYTDGWNRFIDWLEANYYADLRKEAQALADFIGYAERYTFTDSDYDQTLKDAEMYASAIQMPYNALAITAFAEKATSEFTILTSGPRGGHSQGDVGAVTLSTIPDGKVTLAGAMGADVLRSSGQTWQEALTPEQKQLIADAFAVGRSLRDTYFPQGIGEGSDVQCKHTMIAIDAKFGQKDTDNADSQAITSMMREVFEQGLFTNPDGARVSSLAVDDRAIDLGRFKGQFEIEASHSGDLEIKLNVGDENAHAERTKGTGLELMAREFGREYTDQPLLSFGNSGSDVPMTAYHFQKSPDSARAIYVLEDVRNKGKEASLKSSILDAVGSERIDQVRYATSPDHLIAALYLNAQGRR